MKWRLVAMFLLLGLGMSLMFIAGSREAFSTGWRDLIQPLVRDYVDRLAADVGDPPDIARARALVARLPIKVKIEGPRVNWASESSPMDRFDAPGGMLTRATRDGHVIRFGMAGWRGDDHPRLAGWATLAGLLVLVALAFAYVRRLLRPVEDIRDGALRYGSGDFSLPIPLRRRDELGELAAQVNSMATGLQKLLEQQRGLLLAISHELRSPLTRARLNVELVQDGKEKDALLRDLALMRDLVSDLLESERLAGGAVALNAEATDVNELVKDLVHGEFAGRSLVLDLDPAIAPLLLDRSRMQMLLRNLIANALRHNAESGPSVRVTTSADAADGDIRLSVRDFGPGVADQDLARLGQAFYRPDAARTRDAGGVGLGLYLCVLVMRSHRGELRFRNAAPGLDATAIFPHPAA